MRHSEVERSLAQRRLCTNTSALSSHRWRIAVRSIFILALVLIGLLAAQGITTEPAEKDAVENLANAFNLAFHGVYSSDEESAELNPTMRREPLPNFVLAAWMSVLPLSSVEDFASINRGVNIQRLKLINVFWALGVLLFAYLAVWSATRSIFAASLTSLALVPFVLTPGLIDRLMTELPAACLFAAASYFIMLTVQKGTALAAIAAGIAGGLSALTKAVAFYLLPVVAIGLLVILLMQRSALRKTLMLPALFLAASLLVTAPWIARNAIIFGEPQVASRAGSVLYMRMLYDNMTDVEYRGTLYAWSPPSVRKYVGAVLGYKPSDLDLGGSLQLLNRNLFTPDDRVAQRDGRPELATSYYSMARAERKRQANALKDESNSALAAERSMQETATNWIVAHPTQHISLMFPLAWRAMWMPGIPVWLAPPMFLALLLLSFVSLRLRRWDLMAFSLLPLGILLICLAATHCIPRYLAPILPEMYVAAGVLMYLALRSARSLLPAGNAAGTGRQWL